MRAGVAIRVIYLFLLINTFFACTRQEPDINSGVGDYVILLHGLGRSSKSMAKLENRFRAEGFEVINLNYPSTEHDIAYLSRNYLKKVVDEDCRDSRKQVHFVTHSLGGIVVRHYLAESAPVNLGRLVMLGPPNGGSEVVDFLQGSGLGELLLGPAFCELGTAEESIPNSLGAPPCETGVIAGNRTINWINSIIIPGPDDGKVSLVRAGLPGMQDYLIVKRTHPMIMKADEVLDAAVNFIKEGGFKPVITPPSAVQ